MNPLFRFLYNHPRSVVLVICLVTLMLALGVSWVIYESGRKSEQILVEQEANNVKNRLENSLNHSITASKVLAFLVENDLLGDLFDSISYNLLSQNEFMDALQLVEGHTIINTFPLESHEITIGYHVLENELHYIEAMKALDRRSLYFDGPFELLQGGVGIVGRMPILKDGTYWGFSAVIIRFETLLNAAGLNETGVNDLFAYQFAKRERVREVDTFFDHDFDFQTGIVYKTTIPLGDWDLNVKLLNPSHSERALAFLFIGLMLSIFISLFTYKLVNEPYKLEKLVNQKTSDLVSLNNTLEKYTKDLELSNSDLEQFAYVASHDLLEPLRMISSFMNRLKEKYEGSLDEKAKTYIHFAIDGSIRMRRIILDLLEFSRIGNSDEELESIDLNALIDEFRILHRMKIAESKATIEVDELPTIHYFRAPLTHLFHNILDNSLKYHKEGIPPSIKVCCKDLGNKWQFEVSDNGQGIKREYYDQIFLMYKRLHSNENIPGTGMGLAIVKKVIASMNGEIWIKSVPDEGSTFYFTIAKEIS